MDLIEFLLARIAEDETDAANSYDDSERLLAECAAKRAIVAAHPVVIQLWWDEQCEIEVCETCQADSYPDQWPCPTIQALAAVYAAHPDYPGR